LFGLPFSTEDGYSSPKGQLAFKGIHGFISQKAEFCILCFFTGLDSESPALRKVEIGYNE
jgi:hypothetical protein